PFLILDANVKNDDIKTIGVEKNAVSMFRHEQLQRVFPKAAFKDIEPQINNQRLRKSRAEITYLQEAVDIIEKVLAEGLKHVKVGMTELELAGQLEYLMKKFGAT